MKFILALTGCAAIVPGLAAGIAAAQTVSVDHLTQAQLAEKGKELSAEVSPTRGNASTKLSTYPNHYTMMAFRSQSGGAEVHENFADFFYVVKGHATLVSGGTVQNPTSSGKGEIKGTSIQGGARIELSPGDFVHIPAGLPHQLLLAKGELFEYFVIKVDHK